MVINALVIHVASNILIPFILQLQKKQSHTLTPANIEIKLTPKKKKLSLLQISLIRGANLLFIIFDQINPNQQLQTILQNNTKSNKNSNNIHQLKQQNKMMDSQQDDSRIEKEHDIYQRIKLLGTGSFGKAYLVKQIKTDELFVIKQINISDLDASEQDNVRREAKILQALDHPNIIKFKQVYTTSKMKLNIVMEYAGGGDLAAKIQQAKLVNKYFDQTQILTWFTQICLGIKHIHDRKIIHRDIKGQNIFLTEDNCVKIGDLGVARVLQHTVAKAKTMVGSPYYLSPEIIQNRPYSFGSDIWSLGALLYEMCALVPPFTANNLQFLALKIVKGNYASIPTQYSSDLKALIKSMLNTNPHTRPNINQILSTPIIHRRIKSLLTQSQNIKQFSHTILHKFNPLKNKLEDKLRPPPNLMEIQQEAMISNLSALTANSQGRKAFQAQIEVKAKTPYCMGKNPPPLKKKIIPSDKKILDQKTQDLADLMQIKATPLEHHLVPKPVPKITTPNVIKKRPQTSKPIQVAQKIAPKSKNSTASAFNKKKSIDCALYNVGDKIKQMQKQEQESNRLLQNKSNKNEENEAESQKQIQNKSSNLIKHKSPQMMNKVKLQIKSSELKNNGKKIEQKINKPNSIKKPKPVTKNNVKSKQKQLKQTNMQIVSQQMKQKDKHQKQKDKKIIKKVVQKRTKGQTKKTNNERKVQHQQMVEQQKCNDPSDDKYLNQQFETYDQNISSHQQSQQNDEQLSFQLSHSSIQQKKPNNYQKMLLQLELINKIVDQANGKVAELPMLGESIPQLLQTSNQIREDDSDLQSELSKMTSKMTTNMMKKTQGQINLTCITDQGELQNLRMALQQIFGIQDIILVYQFMSQIIMEHGLDFDEQQTIRNLLKKCPNLDQCLLRRHFRLIATVITLQNELHQNN